MNDLPEHLDESPDSRVLCFDKLHEKLDELDAKLSKLIDLLEKHYLK